MAEKALLKTEQLTKTYKNGQSETVALDNVNLHVHERELVALCGPSGSGKTTLLFLLGGLDRPTSGRVYLDGVEISGLDERRLSVVRRKMIGFVFQNYNLVEELTILENVKLAMMFDGTGEGEMNRRALDLLDQLDLAGKERLRPSQLSAGQQQRVATARALANRPRLVLMDEPTGNLDRENSRMLMQLVEGIVQSEGIAFVIATHNLEIVQAAPSRLFLKEGRASDDSGLINDQVL